MTMETIKKAIMDIIPLYPIKRVALFGSRVSGKNRDDSDTYLIEVDEEIELYAA